MLKNLPVYNSVSNPGDTNINFPMSGKDKYVLQKTLTVLVFLNICISMKASECR